MGTPLSPQLDQPSSPPWSRHTVAAPQFGWCRQTLLLVVALLAAGVTASQGAAIVIGGFSAARAGDSSVVTGPYTQELRASVVGANPGSIFKGLDSLTPASLSGVDIVIVGSATVTAPGMTLSAAEQTALLNFIKAGHGAIIFVDNSDFSGGPNESFLDPFGIHAGGKVQGNATATSVAPNHFVMNGPFGEVTTFTTSYGGIFDDLGPNALALANYDVNGQAALAAIAPGVLGAGSGGVVFIADADALVDTAAGGQFHDTDNEKFILNAVRYVPEPSTGSLLACFALVMLRRRRRS